MEPTNRMSRAEFQAKREHLIDMARTRIARLKKSDGSPATGQPNFEYSVIVLLDMLFYLTIEYPEVTKEIANEKS
jgi:hypothetical protein